MTDKTSKEIVHDYEIPSWAGKPAIGLHLDVMKDGKMIQKLMVDEKRYYFFGRNKEANDFQIDHQSCSRVHGVLLWHKHLNRPFLVDLGSTHGTYIGNVRLEANKPQQLFIDSEIRFGASTRLYVIRERPQSQQQQQQQSINSKSSLIQQQQQQHENNTTGNSSSNKTSKTLPETDDDLNNLTEFNTALNKRIAHMVDIGDANVGPNIMATVKKKRKSVFINEEEQIINPEDVDPSVGKFRNLIQTTVVIPNKKRDQMSNSNAISSLKPLMDDESEYLQNKRSRKSDNESHHNQFDIAAKLGIKMPDLAPDVHQYDELMRPSSVTMLLKKPNEEPLEQDDTPSSVYEPRKKKYAKEAWPGRKPTLPLVPPSNGTSSSALYSLY